MINTEGSSFANARRTKSGWSKGKNMTASAPARWRAISLPVSVNVESAIFTRGDFAFSAAMSAAAAKVSPTDAA
jgi:hypothetical protein